MEPNRDRYLHDPEYHYQVHLVGLLLWCAFTVEGRRSWCEPPLPIMQKVEQLNRLLGRI